MSAPTADNHWRINRKAQQAEAMPATKWLRFCECRKRPLAAPAINHPRYPRSDVTIGPQA